MKAFHQMMLLEDSRYLSTITTHFGLYRYLRLHMGISCASAIFTEQIRVKLADDPGQLNMTDDILVFGKNPAEHQKNLLAVLSRLQDIGLTIYLEKCEFNEKEVTFFGLHFSAKGISATEDRCRSLKDVPAPKNVKDLQIFLCSIQFSARFMKNFCTIAEPLWALTRASTPWNWGTNEQTAFNQLKEDVSTH